MCIWGPAVLFSPCPGSRAGHMLACSGEEGPAASAAAEVSPFLQGKSSTRLASEDRRLAHVTGTSLLFVSSC